MSGEGTEPGDSTRGEAEKASGKRRKPGDFVAMGRGRDAAAKAAFNETLEFIGDLLDNPPESGETPVGVLACSYVCVHRAPAFATLNFDLSLRLDEIQDSINAYLQNRTLTRPLNFLVLASPGAGKSQLVKSIAKGIGEKKIEYVPFNMSTMKSPEDLGYALDAARNVVVEGKVPLVFLDEFDTSDLNYALLLPVLWDGELLVGGRKLKLVRCVFFLAGSRSSLPTELKKARDLEESSCRANADSKLVDLFSRINGTVVEIPSLSTKKFDTRAEKVMIAMVLLRLRFTSCEKVPWGLLQFIAETTWRYESRSIATLIDLLALRSQHPLEDVKEITVEDLRRLPLSDPRDLKHSTLAFHLLHPNSEAGISELWEQSLKGRAVQIVRDKALEEEPRGTLLTYANSLVRLEDQTSGQSSR